ncbi:MAG: hypothetical protein JO337_07825 [Acidimicrobiales bacterium]|nr:hypothetical protein [Acidimicrobiales bacterium]
MTVVAFGSVRSCGVTTLALAVAATWSPERRVLLVEADPAGGTLAAASGWPAEPSLVSLAASARRGGDPSLVWEHCNRLPGDASILAAPALGEQAASALGLLGPLLGRVVELDGDVLVDCGRLDHGSPANGIWERADRPVLVCRPRLADLQALASWAENRSLDCRVGLVTVGDGPYLDSEVTEALGLQVLGRMPWDPDAAEALFSVPASARQVRLAPLVRAARTLADRLTLHPTVAAGDGAEPTGSKRAGWAVAAVGNRLWRPWRTDTAPHSNGNVPEEAER